MNFHSFLGRGFDAKQQLGKGKKMNYLKKKLKKKSCCHKQPERMKFKKKSMKYSAPLKPKGQ